MFVYKHVSVMIRKQYKTSWKVFTGHCKSKPIPTAAHCIILG